MSLPSADPKNPPAWLCTCRKCGSNGKARAPQADVVLPQPQWEGNRVCLQTKTHLLLFAKRGNDDVSKKSKNPRASRWLDKITLIGLRNWVPQPQVFSFFFFPTFSLPLTTILCDGIVLYATSQRSRRMLQFGSSPHISPPHRWPQSRRPRKTLASKKTCPGR